MPRIQVDRKSFSPRIELEIRVRAPLGGHWPISDFYTFQDATELLVLSVEDPGAVARFQNGGIHDITMLRGAECQR